ncbi:TetR/AcrR family transcriptional regulator [Sporosarcina sp. FA9]|uniref:TetR/AcrR family transcriptional regulator n=1 Tax=Sporosarcina sp. FA9 TaxID=3413030 RepID=UPI003F6560DF
MRDKTEQIFKGAIAVFIKKGLQGTTQEIAKEADVAEVTLFRRFSTKQNLFSTVLKSILEKKFGSYILELAKEKDTELFLMNVIENRLEVLSENVDLVKMLLSESLKGNLTDEINLPKIIFISLKKGLTFHFKMIDKTVDIDFCARQLGGIFLSYVVLPNDQPFNQLTKEEKQVVARKHAKSVLATIGENDLL